jgi:cell division protein FtsB
MRRTFRFTSYKEIALVALFTLGTVWVGYLTWGIVGKEERARNDVNDTKAQLAGLEARETTLKSDLDELNTPRGQEAALRDTQGVVKPGEHVIIVVPEEPQGPATTTKSWWESFLEWF